ncbi:MAG: DUF4403 family protein [Marinilabiliales bacterium]|nr:DUF4403 family protein [Marinilabiliales bacterium]
MKKTLYPLLLGLSVLFTAGCRSLQPQRPAESYKYVPAKPKTSLLTLQADLEVSRIEQVINSQVDSLLYEDNSFLDKGGDNLMIKAWKNGAITMSLEQDVLAWEIPLKVNLKKTVGLFVFKLPVGDILEANGEISLRFRTTFKVNRDWSIKTETVPNGYDWVKKPTMKLAGFTIPVKAMADLLLRVNLSGYSKEIDQAITASFDLRSYAEKGWQMIYEPFKLPGDYQAWLSINPYSVSLLPVKGSKGMLHFRTAVTADVECLLDKKPPVGKIMALPDLKTLEAPSDTFHINLLTDIPYATIERMTMEVVRDSVFTFGKRKLRFESFHVYGSNGKMVIETNVRGSVNGTIFLTGNPTFHAADTTLHVENLKFDLKTRNLLTRSAKWLFNGKIERSLTEAIAIPFHANLQSVEDQLQNFLKGYQIGYGFQVHGKLSKIAVSELLLAPESVKANLLFSGSLAIGISDQIGKLPPKP